MRTRCFDEVCYVLRLALNNIPTDLRTIHTPTIDFLYRQHCCTLVSLHHHATPSWFWLCDSGARWTERLLFSFPRLPPFSRPALLVMLLLATRAIHCLSAVLRSLYRMQA
jgi:hypothetical protein